MPDDTSDLPSANPERPRDPTTGKFLPKPADVAPPESNLGLLAGQLQESAVTPEVSSLVSQVVQPKAAPPPAHDPHIVSIAQSLGVPDADIESMGPAELSRTVNYLHRKDREYREQMEAQRSAFQAPAPKPTEPEPELFKEEEIQEYNEHTQPLMRALNKQDKRGREQDKTIAELKAQLQEERQRVERTTLIQQVDAKFAALGEAYVGVFGDKPISQLKAGSPEAIRRQAAISQVGVRPDHPEFDQRFDAVVSALYGKAEAKPKPKEKQLAQDTVHISPERWNRGGLVPPTQRNGVEPTLTRRERMIREEAEKQREQGVPIGPLSFDDNSDLPRA